MRCPIGIAFQGNRGHADVRSFSEPLFQLIIFRLAFSQPEPPAVIVDHDADVIRVVEGRGAALEGGLVEVPFRRSDLPDELRKVAPVFVVADPAAFGGEVILVPPLQLSLWRQRHLAGLLAADQIPAHRDETLAAFRPQRRDDVGRARAPIKTAEDRPANFECIHQSDDIDSDHRLLAIAGRCARKKARRAIATQIGDDHPVACLRKPRGNVDKAVNVIGPAVQQHDRRTIALASFSVADVQDAGIDLFQRTEGRARPVPHHTCHLSAKTSRPKCAMLLG